MEGIVLTPPLYSKVVSKEDCVEVYNPIFPKNPVVIPRTCYKCAFFNSEFKMLCALHPVELQFDCPDFELDA